MGAVGWLWCFLSPLAAWSAATMNWGALTLLFLLLVDVTAQVESTAEAAVPFPGKYRHRNPATGTKIYCDKCPAGTHVSKHCTSTSLRECTPCKNGTFTRHENGIDQCHNCSKPCVAPMMEESSCIAFSDRVCICPPRKFLSNNTCVRHTACAIGSGVRKKGTPTEDVKCKLCPHGTFSNVSSPLLKCAVLTNCSELGKVVLVPGNRERNNVCGSPSTVQNTTVWSSTGATHHINGAPSISTATAIFNQLITTAESITSNVISQATKEAQNLHQIHTPSASTKLQTVMETSGAEVDFKPPRKGPMRPSAHKHFDINEHLPWMIVLFLLLVLVVTVVCSIKKSSRVLKKGPKQDPSSIVEKAGLKKPRSPTRNKEKWIYYSNGQANQAQSSQLHYSSMDYPVENENHSCQFSCSKLGS